jgi:hypothetical protein
MKLSLKVARLVLVLMSLTRAAKTSTKFAVVHSKKGNAFGGLCISS